MPLNKPPAIRAERLSHRSVCAQCLNLGREGGGSVGEQKTGRRVLESLTNFPRGQNGEPTREGFQDLVLETGGVLHGCNKQVRLAVFRGDVSDRPCNDDIVPITAQLSYRGAWISADDLHDD